MITLKESLKESLKQVQEIGKNITNVGYRISTLKNKQETFSIESVANNVIRKAEKIMSPRLERRSENSKCIN